MEEDCVEAEKRRRDRFSEILQFLLQDNDNLSAIARKFGREPTYVRRWVYKQGFPFLVDYLSLQKLLNFHTLDALIEFIDSGCPVEDCRLHAEASYSFYLERLANRKRKQAQELEQEARFLIALNRQQNQKKVGRTPSPTKLKDHEMDKTHPLSYSECEKLDILINVSADERNLPPEEVFRRAKTSVNTQMHLKQPEHGTYYIDVTQLERLLPYLYVAACWSPFEFERPLRSYGNVQELIDSLQLNGSAHPDRA